MAAPHPARSHGRGEAVDGNPSSDSTARCPHVQHIFTELLSEGDVRSARLVCREWRSGIAVELALRDMATRGVLMNGG